MIMNLMMVLDAAATDAGQGATGRGSIGFMIAYLAFFALLIYFLFIKPTRKQSRQQEEMMSSLKPGDSIMTTSGFYGTVIGIDDDTVIVEFGNNKNCRIPMHKKAIAEVESADAAYDEPEKEEEAEEKEPKKKLGKKKN